MNVITARQKLLAHLITYPFQNSAISSEYVLKLNLTPNMPESTSFLLNNRKNRPAVGSSAPRPPMPPAARGYALRSPD